MAALPAQFAALEPFVAAWAHATEGARSKRRWAASPAEHQAFYDAMLPRLDELLDYFARFEAGAVPEDARALYHLALAFAEAAPHVELYRGAAEVPNSFAASRFIADHADVEER
jgi:hypothetical protein